MNRSTASVFLAVLALSASSAAGQTRPAATTTPSKPAVRPAAKTEPAKAAPARPFDPYAPTVLGMVTNANELLRDIETAMSLTSPADQKQWPELVKYLDVFLTGVDRTRVARMDLIFDDDTLRYRPSFPILADQLGNFRKNNLDSLGIESRQTAGQTYQLKNAFIGYMRYKDEYATLAERMSDIPQTLPDPTRDIAHLVAKGYHAAIDGRNVNDGQEDRRRAFDKAHKDAAAALKRSEKETAEEFTIRRAWLDWRYNEMQKFYVESSRLLVGGIVDNSERTIRFDIELAPIAGTSLDAAIQSTREHTSRFAVVERGENPILSLRVNFPLDEVRIADLSRVIDAYRVSSQRDIDGGTERTADEKQHTKKAADLFYDFVIAILKTGRLDGFIESRGNPSGKNTFVGAGVIPDSSGVLAILDVLPKSGQGNAVELNADETGGVKIHRVTAPSGFRADFKEFFGDETILVGTSKDVLWLASGENALAELKAAIAKVADGDAKAAPQTMLDGVAKLGPWLEQWHKHRGEAGRAKSRERALGAFRAGDDILTIDLSPVDNRVEGEIAGRPGVLRYIGAILAEFTRNIEK